MTTDNAHLFSAGWRSADDAGRAQRTAFLDAAAPVLAGPRRASLQALRLRPGASVLDAGCGTGIATAEIAGLVGPDGRAVGVDADPGMAAATAARATVAPNIEAHVGDVRALQFADGTFDAARLERVLIHLTPPQDHDAVAELVRVTRPGGRVAVLEPDMAQMSLDAGEAVHAVRAAALTQVANPRAGVRLRASLLDAGCLDVDVDVRTVVLTDVAAFRRIGWPHTAVAGLAAQGLVTAGLVEEAEADLTARAAACRFLSVHVLYVVSGTVPTRGERASNADATGGAR